MMYRAKLSFVDPFTGRVFLRGKLYSVTDKQHVNYLERHGLIERMKTPPVESSAGANVHENVPKRKKAGR